MDKDIREKCKVEIIECIHVEFKGVKDKDSLALPEDDGVIAKFAEFCMRNEIHPIGGGGAIGPGIYSYRHRNENRDKIIGFFEKEGIDITIYSS